MGLLNYTTKIDADKTAQEIAKCLSMHGASAILTDYSDGILSAISFKAKLNGSELGFRLPCDWRPVFTIITKDAKMKEWHSKYAGWTGHRGVRLIAYSQTHQWTPSQFSCERLL